MKKAMAGLLLLSGCSAWLPATTVICPQPGRVEPATVIVRPQAAPPVASPSPPAAAVLTTYKAQAAREVDVVSSPAVTADTVHNVVRADRAARRALVALEREGHQPKAATVAAARSAVNQLSDVLAQSSE